MEGDGKKRAVRILITGVTGALGRSVARCLLASGHEVGGIAEACHDYLDPGVDFVCGGLGDPVLQDLADDADAVIHLAPVDDAAPGSAGIDGLVRVVDAAARGGARLLFPSQAAGSPERYGHAEKLVSSGWAPSLVIRMAPPVGRQLDWMVTRTAATLLRTKESSAVRLLHVDDLHRFLVRAVATDRTGVVDLATADTTSVVAARRLLAGVDRLPRRVRPWSQLTPKLDVAGLQHDWDFECGWTASDAVADLARGLTAPGRDSNAATVLPSGLPLPLEAIPRGVSSDGTPLLTAAPEGLEGEFDDKIDPRFPVFGATSADGALPGPLSPMSLDVQLSALRTANRATGHVLALRGPLANEWESRRVAVFGHRLYAGLSTGAAVAAQLSGWDSDSAIHQVPAERSDGDRREIDLFPLGRPSALHGLRGSATRAAVLTRALGSARQYKLDVLAYSAAAVAERKEALALASMGRAGLEVRIRLLRDRIRQGWALSALGGLVAGSVAATPERDGESADTTAAEVMDLGPVAAETTALVYALRRNPGLCALAEAADLDGIRAAYPTFSSDVYAAAARIGHRGPGEAELANRVFGDDPALLLTSAARAAQDPGTRPTPEGATASMRDRFAARAQECRELAHDATMRFTHDLRMTLREMGSRCHAEELIDTADDVFYLTCDELLTLPPDAPLRIKRRRAERERLQALRLPDVIDHTWTPSDDGPSLDVGVGGGVEVELEVELDADADAEVGGDVDVTVEPGQADLVPPVSA